MAPLYFPIFSSIATRPERRSEIHAPSAIQCKVVQWAKRLRPKPKSRQLLPLRRATWSSLRLCRFVSRVQGSFPLTLQQDESGYPRVLASFGIISRQRQEAAGSTEAIFAWSLAAGVEPGLEWWRGSRAAPWRFWVKATWSRAGFRLRIRPMARRRDRTSAFP